MLELHGKGTWDDMGALKTWLRDDLITERNALAKRVVKDLEAQERKAGRRPRP